MIELSPSLDRVALAEDFARRGRVQIRDVLTEASARGVQDVLMKQTPWSLAWQAGEDGPHLVRSEQLAKLDRAAAADLQGKLFQAAASPSGDFGSSGDRYAFVYFSYPLVTAYLERWSPGSPLEALLEDINSAPFLDLVREVCASPDIVKADGQATLYGPGHFLSHHDDANAGQGLKVAYVLNFTVGEWRPEWGGYLQFFDEDWNLVEAMRPRFNSLNLFRVPQVHSVSYVPPYSPIGRYAITGWARDR